MSPRMMFSTIAVSTAVAMLAACTPAQKISEETRAYTLLDYNPPKRFYVDLKDNKTGEVFKNIYVSKRCSNHKNLQIGATYDLTRVTYQKGQEQFTQFKGLYEKFCRPSTP